MPRTAANSNFQRPARRRTAVLAVTLLASLAGLRLAFAETAGSLQFAPQKLGDVGSSVLRLAPPDASPRPAAILAPPAAVMPSRPMAITQTAALIKQPDAPRSPVIQPVPLPPPAEMVPPGGADTPVKAPGYGEYGIRPIGSLTVNIQPKQGQVPQEVDGSDLLDRQFSATEFHRTPIDYSYFWESPAFFHKPLYFEQPNLERYGYDWGIGQFWISGAQFFVKIPLLPYMMTVHHPHERVYSLGYYRPGSRAPYQFNWPDIRPSAITVETAFITGLCFLIP